MACCWDLTVLSLFPPGLEVDHHQHATSVYFDDPQAVFCDQREWLILLHALILFTISMLKLIVFQT